MHISDGILSAPVVAATSVAAAGLVGYSFKGVKTDEVPRIALMTSVFFVGSMIHVPIGPASIHLLLTGIIGVILGKRTPIAIALALILQMLLFQFGGMTSLGVNIINTSVPAMLMYWLIKPLISENKKGQFLCGLASGLLSVVGTILLVSLCLIETNAQFGIGAFSTINMLLYGHIPIMIIEGIFTGFVVKFICSVRPEILAAKPKDKNANYEDNPQIIN